MNEEHQDKTYSKPMAADDELWVPPRLAKDRSKLKRLQKRTLIQRIGLAGKTPLEIFQLLLLPVVLAASGYWYSFTQVQSSQRGHLVDLQIAADQQRETRLKDSLDEIRDLLLNKNLSGSQAGDEVRVVARLEVLTALRHLDGERKRLLMLFLSDAKLISTDRNDVIIDLSHADLSNTDLSNIDLSGAHLSHASLNNANLSNANLSNANLSNANLSNANLSNANLNQANASQANVSQARLLYTKMRGAHLDRADLNLTRSGHVDMDSADLRQANLTRSDMIGANLRGANLADAVLHGSILIYANLNHAKLMNANLNHARLMHVDLSNADLRNARITRDQLAEVASLKKAIMPDGSIHP
ncbi:pentapeptide repeat-containing protein [Dictyobacter aurantiacus]|nr:pentapeptide repeat-containing protein [Dictyobacter aurantiacus]